MNSEKFKKALRIAVNIGCGFEGDAEDAASLLSLIETNEARIAELEGLVQQFVWVGNDLIDDNNNPITITLFDALVYKAKEREKNG